MIYFVIWMLIGFLSANILPFLLDVNDDLKFSDNKLEGFIETWKSTTFDDLVFVILPLTLFGGLTLLYTICMIIKACIKSDHKIKREWNKIKDKKIFGENK